MQSTFEQPGAGNGRSNGHAGRRPRLVRPKPTGEEVEFGLEEIIVSKTDLTGKITYANDVFLRVAGYTEEEVLGQPHSMIRHPDMPRCIFKLLWDSIQDGNEIFAYVKKITKNGGHYWVFAHVTPTFDAQGSICGYHSNRRKPDRRQVETVQQLYATLLDVERRHTRKADAIAASTEELMRIVSESHATYEEFVFSI